MSTHFTRRDFVGAAVTASTAAAGAQAQTARKATVGRLPGSAVRLALNSYSFNQPLREKSIDLNGVVDYCAQHGIGALDATGYYFEGYPQAPAPAVLHALKRRAFVHGVSICGTGVRNDFAVTDAGARQRDIAMTKAWIDAASLLGASVIRLFSGLRVAEGSTFDATLEWMIPAFRECAEYGERHGVVVGLQNHNDFVKTAAETIRIVEAVNSEWFGVILDVGSLRTADPYEEIERLLPYAVSWQLKETVWYGKKDVPIDLARVKVARFLEKVRAVFG